MGRLNGQKNVYEVFYAWVKERRKASGAISTDGQTIYSYDTAILTRSDDGRIVLNRTKYSPTTSRHQNGIRAGLDRENIHLDVVVLNGVDKNAGRDALIKRAFPTLV